MTASARVGPPEVSVVMVTFNRWNLVRRAVAALEEHTPHPHELIVVDNASSDGTASRLRALEGITLLQNPVNLGFGVAANQGAGLASAPYVVQLNSDTEVQPGWLGPLLSTAESHPDVGAVAPRLLYPDGRLQEAGSIVWRDGRVRNYGDGDDPGRPEYWFRRTVDYASAACLLIRRSALIEVGGFDPGYAPVYYEDVDLCLALAERGWRIVYEPASTVVHVRGGSSGRPPRQALLVRNRARLQARWRDVLDRRPPESWYAEDSAILGGRDATTCERVLVLTGRLPGAEGGPGERRMHALVTAAARRWPRVRWTVAALDGHDGDGRLRALGAAGIESVPGNGSWPSWLHARRYHYGVVVDTDPRWSRDPLAAALMRTQPQAARVRVNAAVDALTVTAPVPADPLEMDLSAPSAALRGAASLCGYA